MHRFYVDPENIDHHSKMVKIADEEARHINKVLRFNAGDEITAFDGQGNEMVLLLELQGKQWLGRIMESARPFREARHRVALVQGLAKADKMDLIIQKAVEIGISDFYPVITRNSVVRLEDGKKGSKTERWQAIAREACKQCRRTVVPEVHAPLSLSELWADPDFAAQAASTVIAYEKAEGGSLNTIINAIKDSPFERVNIMIGPEGGFDPAEVDQARRHGALVAGLGPRILRTETAGLVMASLVLYELGDLG